MGAETIYLDTKRSRPERDAMLGALGLRQGDELLLLYERHLGGSPVADRVWREKVEALGVKITICPPPKGAPGRKPDHGSLPPEHEAEARARWLGDGTEMSRLRAVERLVGHPVGKGLLAWRFGVPSNPKPWPAAAE